MYYNQSFLEILSHVILRLVTLHVLAIAVALDIEGVAKKDERGH